MQLIEGESQDTYRSTVVGLLYVEDAREDLLALDQLIRFLADNYRADLGTISHAEVRDRLGLTETRWARILPYLEDVRIYGIKEFPWSEHYLERHSLTEALEQKYARLYEEQSSYRSTYVPIAPFTARLTRLRLSGFRSLAEVTVDLGPLTVLVGPNGVGKSSLLDSVGFAATATSQGLSNALGLLGGFNRVRTRGSAGPVSLELGFVADWSGRLLSGSYGFAFGLLHKEVVVESEALHFDGRELIKGGRGSSRITLPSGETEDVFHAASALALSTISDAGRYAPIAYVRDALSQTVLLDREPQIDTPQDYPWFAPSLHRRSQLGRPLADALKEVLLDDSATGRLGEIIPEFIPWVQSTRTQRTESGSLELLLREMDSEHEFSIDEVSAGTRQSVLLAAMYALPRAPTVLLLEEPEAALHPQALLPVRDLLRSLARRSTVIATSHSPAFVGSFDSSLEVKALMRKDRRVELSSLREAVGKRTWLREFGPTGEAFLYSAEKKAP